MGYVALIFSVLLLPVLYSGFLLWYREDFHEEENRRKKPLRSKGELIVLAVSEAALLRIWYALGMEGFSSLRFCLLYVMLAGITFFCVTDLWEHVVPNKILLLLLMIFIIILGIHGLIHPDVVLELLPAIILGLLFCALSFGLGYLISRKSMGAGDVKLALVMGLYLTGEYVVGAILYGCLVSAGYSLIQMARKKLSRKDQIPFVPFLYIGVIIRYLIG